MDSSLHTEERGLKAQLANRWEEVRGGRMSETVWRGGEPYTDCPSGR